MRLEVFKRGNKVSFRIVTFEDDSPKANIKIIEDESIPKLVVKFQDILFDHFKEKNQPNGSPSQKK
jgi:hypothetical protein